MKLRPFMAVLVLICAGYLLFWVAMLGATATYTTPAEVWQVLVSREIRYATALSLISCTLAALFSVAVAVPIGYLMSRTQFRGRAFIDAALDIPIVLPPMVVGLCLLIFFQTHLGHAIEKVIPFTYTVAGVVLAQFVIAAAFAIRTMRGVFDHLPARP
jgi:molybdate transport system permease protein